MMTQNMTVKITVIMRKSSSMRRRMLRPRRSCSKNRKKSNVGGRESVSLRAG